MFQCRIAVMRISRHRVGTRVRRHETVDGESRYGVAYKVSVLVRVCHPASLGNVLLSAVWNTLGTNSWRASGSPMGFACRYLLADLGLFCEVAFLACYEVLRT